MAESNESSGTPWLAFLTGLLLMGILAVGYFVYTGSSMQPQRTAELQVNMPDINMPNVSPPQTPPAPQGTPSTEPTLPEPADAPNQ